MPTESSPFPGMDPYLEQYWGDVHQTLITYARDQIQAQLPQGLYARVQERVFLETGNGEQRRFPDLRVVERGRVGKTRSRTKSHQAVASPVLLEMPDEPQTEGFVEIHDSRSGNKLVTVLEFLSPANKCTPAGRKLYLGKQRELLKGQVSLVEIDLLRSGRHVLSAPRAMIPTAEGTHYKICVRRGWRPWPIEYYPVPLRQALPTFRVPLRKTDKDVFLDLQALLRQCYRNGRYASYVDYTVDPDPPLEPADARWAADLLRKKGKA